MRRHDRIDLTGGTVLVALCAAWGLTQVAIKIAGMEGLPAMLQAALRSLGAAVLLCAWTFARDGVRGLRKLLARDDAFWPGMLIAALFAAEFLCIFPAMQLTTASRGILFVYTAPFWVAIGAHLLVPGERLTSRQMAGLLCAFVGVACALADGLWHGGGSIAGDALAGLGAAFWGLTTVAVKASRRLQAISPAKQLLYQLAGSVPYLLLAAAVTGQWRASEATPVAWAWLGYQTVVVAFISYLSWFWLIAYYPAGRLSAFSFLTPVFGMIAGAVLLHEPVTAELAVALVLVATGIRLVNGPKPASAQAAKAALGIRSSRR
ncbi:MAG: DMT family transporter [Acetobacteraceae bacterium]|nr:DMT family transporter [Acetobacteraceae bacterium]